MSRYVELAFDHIEHLSNRADAVLFDFGEPEHTWVPKSQINMDEFDPDSHVVEVTEWFAAKEGLI